MSFCIAFSFAVSQTRHNGEQHLPPSSTKVEYCAGQLRPTFGRINECGIGELRNDRRLKKQVRLNGHHTTDRVANLAIVGVLVNAPMALGNCRQ